MSNPVVLSIDCGTQSMRALLFDQKGNLLAKAQHKYERPYYSLNSGWAEQKLSFYWQSLCKVCNEAKEKNPDIWEKIICVTLAPFRDSFTCVDKEGNVLRDLILWLDQRRAKCQTPLPAMSKIAFSLVGMTEALDVQRKITKSNWIAENEPNIWEKTYKYMSIGGVLGYYLTGELKEATAAMIGHVPFDYKPKKWKSVKDIQFPLFGIPLEKLPPLVDPCEVIGYITKQACEQTGIKEGLPFISSGSDKGCETLGSGVVRPNTASLSFGTSATVQIATKKYVEPSPLLPAYPAVIPDMYNPEVQIFRGYWMISWFLKEFAEKEVKKAKELNCVPEELLNKELEKIPAGCEGLMVQPLWSPLLKNPEGKGSIIGFSDTHTRAHIYRAIIEGIGFGLYDGLKNLEKRSGQKIDYLCAAGGGSQADAICQITANMFGVPLRRAQTYETTGLGAAMVGFVSQGIYKDFNEALDNMVRVRDEFLPNMKEHEIYMQLYSDIYSKTYPRLKPIYTRLYEILKKQG